ncbi:HLA class II histocompatibility antigen, DM beta chain-like [Anas acuta]|uniref:HLA class II histocompatibility antigen, DM beta chain-like n=1 Tax=Anas acuta TaxID=28680 RepID=UPI0035C913E7
MEDSDCRNDIVPTNPEFVWDTLLQMNAYKTIGPDGIHPRSILHEDVPVQTQVLIIPVETGNARAPVCLSCHIWGFCPPEVTVIWLHNGDIVEPDDYNPISAIPNDDWSYQTLVAPVAGDTYTCSVQHVSLQEPLLEDWSPGLMPEVTILVVVATVLMVLGLGLFLTGVYRFRVRPPALGYTPLPGDNYPAGNGVPI